MGNNKAYEAASNSGIPGPTVLYSPPAHIGVGESQHVHPVIEWYRDSIETIQNSIPYDALNSKHHKEYVEKHCQLEAIWPHVPYSRPRVCINGHEVGRILQAIDKICGHLLAVIVNHPWHAKWFSRPGYVGHLLRSSHGMDDGPIVSKCEAVDESQP